MFYLLCLGIGGEWGGPLLWPAVALHGSLSFLLARNGVGETRAEVAMQVFSDCPLLPRGLLLPGLVMEAIPGVAVFPFWSLVVGTLVVWGTVRPKLNLAQRNGETNSDLVPEGDAPCRGETGGRNLAGHSAHPAVRKLEHELGFFPRSYLPRLVSSSLSRMRQNTTLRPADLPAAVTPSSAGKDSRNVSGCCPHRYLCHRCWKPQVLRLSSALNSVTATSD